MRTFKTRLLSLALAIVMVLSMMPAALADDVVTTEHESEVVGYANCTTTAPEKEAMTDPERYVSYVGSSNTLTEEAAIAAGAVFAITGAASAGGAPVTYYYNEKFSTSEEHANYCEPVFYALKSLYGVDGQITMKLLADVQNAVTGTSGGYGWLYVSTAKTSDFLDQSSKIVLDFNGRTLTTNTDLGNFIVARVGTYLVKGGTLIYNGGRAAFNPNSADATAANNGDVHFILDNMNVVTNISDSIYAGYGAFWFRRSARATIKNSTVFNSYVAKTDNTDCSGIMKIEGSSKAPITATVVVENSTLLTADATSGVVFGCSSTAGSLVNLTIAGKDTWLMNNETYGIARAYASGNESYNNKTSKITTTVTGGYPTVVTTGTYNDVTYNVMTLDLAGYEAGLGVTYYTALADALAAAKVDDTVVLLTVPAVTSIQLKDGVTLDATAIDTTALTVTNALGEAQTAVNGKFGPYTTGAAQWNGTIYPTLDAALAAATSGEIVLLADASSSIVLKDGVTLNANGFNAGTVVDMGDTVIVPVADIYNPASNADLYVAVGADGTKYKTLETVTQDTTLLKNVENDVVLKGDVVLDPASFTVGKVSLENGTEVLLLKKVYDAKHYNAENAKVMFTSADGTFTVNCSLCAAMEYVKLNDAGATIKLLEDITINGTTDVYNNASGDTYPVEVPKNLTIDLNGKTLEAKETQLIRAKVEGVKLTVNGNNGTLKSGRSCLRIIEGATVDASNVTLVTTNDVEGQMIQPAINITGKNAEVLAENTLTNVTIQHSVDPAFHTDKTTGKVDVKEAIYLAKAQLTLVNCDMTSTSYGIVGSTNDGKLVLSGTDNKFTHKDIIFASHVTEADKVTYEGTYWTRKQSGQECYTTTFTATAPAEDAVAFADVDGDWKWTEGTDVAYTTLADAMAAAPVDLFLLKDVTEDIVLTDGVSVNTTYVKPTGKIVVAMEANGSLEAGNYEVLPETFGYDKYVVPALEAAYQETPDASIKVGTFNVAFAAANDETIGGGTMFLLDDYSSQNSYAIEITKGMTMDLNGHTVTGATHGFRLFDGDAFAGTKERLTVTSSADEKGTINVQCTAFRVVHGNLSVKNLNINAIATTYKTSGVHTFMLLEKGDNTFFIDNCVIERRALKGVTGLVVNMSKNNTVTVTDSIMKTNSGAIFDSVASDRTLNLFGYKNEFYATEYNWADSTSSGTVTTGYATTQYPWTTTESADENGYYVTTFEAPTGIASIEDLGMVYETLEEAMADAALYGCGVKLTADTAEDVNLPIGITFDVGLFAYTGTVTLVDETGEAIGLALPVGSVYDGNVEVQADYILGDKTYVVDLKGIVNLINNGAVANTGVIKLRGDVTDNTTGYLYYIKKGLTLDLNGYTIENESAGQTANSHLICFQDAPETDKLVIMDSSEAKTGKLKAEDTVLVARCGSIELNGVTLENYTDNGQPTLWLRETVAESTVTDSQIIAKGSEGKTSGAAINLAQNTLKLAGNTTITAGANTIGAIYLDGGDLKIAGDEVVVNHANATFYYLYKDQMKGTVTFDKGKTYKTEAITTGEGEDAVVTGYKTTVTKLNNVVAEFAKVNYYIPNEGNALTDAANNVYATVSEAFAAAVMAWKEKGSGEIDLYKDVNILDGEQVNYGEKGGNMIIVLRAAYPQLVLDLNGHTVTAGDGNGANLPAGAKNGNAAFLSTNTTGAKLEVKNGTINWAGSRSVYLAGSSSTDSTQVVDVTFNDVNVSYVGSASAAQYNHAAGSTLTINGGEWTQSKGIAMVSPTKSTDGTTVHINGATMTTPGTKAVQIGNNAAQPKLYVENAVFYTTNTAGDIFTNSASDVTAINWIYGGPHSAANKLVHEETEKAGVYKTTFVPAAAEAIVAFVDDNFNGQYDLGEPSYLDVAIALSNFKRGDILVLKQAPAEGTVIELGDNMAVVAKDFDVTVNYKGAALTKSNGVYAPAEASYNGVTGSMRMAFRSWWNAGLTGAITLLKDFTLVDVDELGVNLNTDEDGVSTAVKSRFICIDGNAAADGSADLTLNLNSFTLDHATMVGLTEVPNLFSVLHTADLTVNGNGGKIMKHGSRYLVSVGKSDTHDFNGTITFNDVELESTAAGVGTFEINGTSNGENKFILNNVTHKGYNGMFSHDKDDDTDTYYPSNMKFELTGNSVFYHRAHTWKEGTILHQRYVLEMIDGETAKIDPTVKFYSHEPADTFILSPIDGYEIVRHETDVQEVKYYRTEGNQGTDAIDRADPAATLTQYGHTLTSNVETFNITTVYNAEQGTVELSKNAAEYGEVITVTITPKNGYELADFKVVDADGDADFTVADVVDGVAEVDILSDTTITVTFKAVEVEVTKYNVTVDTPENGRVEVTALGEVEAGTEVTVTVTPADGYELDTLTVNGTAVAVVDGKYTFNVEADTAIAATFKAIPPAGEVLDRGKSLELKEVVYIKVYTAFNGFEGVDFEKNGGLLVWKNPVEDANATVETADTNLPGLDDAGTYQGVHEYSTRTEGIPAKNFGDTIYFRVFVKDNNGNYTYGPLIGYSVKQYAENQLAKPTGDGKKGTITQEAKNVCIQMLHYGAAAQVSQQYKTEQLVNADIIDMYPGAAWDENLLTPAKEFTTDIVKSDIVLDRGKSLELKGSLLVNAYARLNGISNDKVTIAEMLFWGPEGGHLTTENVLYRVDMSYDSKYNEYKGVSNGIAAKDYSKTIYFCPHFVVDGVDYYGQVIAYGPEIYASSQLAKPTGNGTNGTIKAADKETCKMLVLYGEAARINFKVSL